MQNQPKLSVIITESTNTPSYPELFYSLQKGSPVVETLTWVPQFVNQTSEILLYVMQNTTEKQCLLHVPFSRV